MIGPVRQPQLFITPAVLYFDHTQDIFVTSRDKNRIAEAQTAFEVGARCTRPEDRASTAPHAQ
jgi:hypothetical protein